MIARMFRYSTVEVENGRKKTEKIFLPSAYARSGARRRWLGNKCDHVTKIKPITWI
jgi:hypothetical protein